jgi:hypothetical protein
MVGPARNYAYRHGNRGEPLTLPTASNTTLTAANGVGVGELTDGAGLTVMGKGYETIGIYRSADDSLVPVCIQGCTAHTSIFDCKADHTASWPGTYFTDVDLADGRGTYRALDHEWPGDDRRRTARTHRALHQLVSNRRYNRRGA